MTRRFYDPQSSEFIQLSDGREYIRKFEVVGLRWCQYIADDGGFAWHLKVFFNEAAHMIVYGEDARVVMRAFDLPENPPEHRRDDDDVI
jgi:hypothetical protein